MQAPLNLKNKLQSSPLVSVSKASTPIRHRVMSNSNQANSTPININKLQSKEKSLNLNNKENQNYNQENSNNTNLLGSKFVNSKNNSVEKNQLSKTMTMNLENFKTAPHNESFERNFEKSTANLSPIMALNRKLSQGPFKMSNFRSLTPNIVKSNDSFEDLNQNLAQNQNQYQSVKNLNNSRSQTSNNPLRDKTNLNFALTGLRSSNSFTNLFQSQNKNKSPTPTRLGSLALNSLVKKNLVPSNLKSSIKQDKIGNNTFGANIFSQTKKLTESNRKKSLITSKSFDRMMTVQPETDLDFQNQRQNVISPRASNLEIMCNNNHNKKAKYRVKVQEQSDQILAYCSKCAIQLVQKGFSVQELSPSISELNSNNQNQSFQNCQNFQNYSKNYGSPKLNFRQSNSFKNKFQSYKNSYVQSQQGFKLGQGLKSKLIQKKYTLEGQKKQFEEKFERDSEEIDCYYNSIINFVEEQRKKDKQRIIDEKMSYQKKFNVAYSLNNVDNAIQQVSQMLENRIIDTYTLKKQMKQAQVKYVELFNLSYPSVNKFLFFNEDMQSQFDNFAQNFPYFSLKFQTNASNSQNSKSYHIGKNNALRFSFEKALQIQKKKQFLQGNNMRTLHEQSEEYEENSYGEENMMEDIRNNSNMQNRINSNLGLQESMNQQNSKQQPFRTLFPQDEQYDEDHVNNEAHSPNFKVI